jgi:pyridoxal phosphate enzyme (YggS family)
MSSIADRLAEVRDRIAAAASRAGRSPDDITLVGAAKGVAVERVREAVEAGLRDIGENYVQELLSKRAMVGDAARWHVIGRLQRNKVKYVAPFCAMIHSLDSVRLAEEIDRRARACGRRVPVLIEVNVAGEGTKAGVAPEEVLDLARVAGALEGLDVQGLMTMPPYGEDPEQSRPHFAKMRALAERLAAQSIPGVQMRHLSMGMSGDYEVAIEEGATIVRVGTALFGPRPAQTKA